MNYEFFVFNHSSSIIKNNIPLESGQFVIQAEVEDGLKDEPKQIAEPNN